VVCLISSSGLVSQNPQVQAKSAKSFPIIVFSSVKWSADPSYYSVAIDSTGTATYESSPNGLDRTGVPYTIEFEVSDRTRRIAFNLAQRLDYFAGSFGESTSFPDKNQVRTLAYRYGEVRNQFTYSASSDPNIEEITSVFEELSQTFEDGRRLVYAQQHNKRAISSQLESMQKKAERHAVRELQALVPILRGVASDSELDRQVRDQAARLLAMAQR
jgi:hypothetical protein